MMSEAMIPLFEGIWEMVYGYTMFNVAKDLSSYKPHNDSNSENNYLLLNSKATWFVMLIKIYIYCRNYDGQGICKKRVPFPIMTAKK